MRDRTEHIGHGSVGRRTYFFKADGNYESVIECCKRYLTLVEKLVG
jgi:hypothetical protein